MRTSRLALVIALGLSTVSLPVFSSDLGLLFRGSDARSSGGDPNRGRFVAFGGFYGDLRISCVQCHGLNGAGDSSGAFPRLTDQAGWYLYKSLEDYAAGLRPSDLMRPIARLLTAQQMQDVAAYYASVRNAPYPPPPVVDVQVRQIGGAIAAAGIPSQGVPACSGCHGPRGVGRPPIYPYLAGQYAPYLEHQLMLWKQGRRDGDPMNIMELIAKAMTREQIHAVSLYYASVRPTDVTPQDQALVSRAGRPTGEGASTFKRNPTSVGATPEPQVGQGAGVVSGAQPAAPPAPTVEFPIGLPRRPADPNRLPPYLPFTDGQRGGMTTTGAPPGDRK